MSTKNSIFLTSDNEHWYHEAYAQEYLSTNSRDAYVLEFSSKHRIITNEDKETLVVVEGDTDLYNELRKLETLRMKATVATLSIKAVYHDLTRELGKEHPLVELLRQRIARALTVLRTDNDDQEPAADGSGEELLTKVQHLSEAVQHLLKTQTQRTPHFADEKTLINQEQR